MTAPVYGFEVPEHELFNHLHVIPNAPERLIASSEFGGIYDLNIRDGECRLICISQERDPIVSITNDGQRVA